MSLHRVYLQLIRSAALAYVEHNTSVIDGIYHSWLAVFLCRIWQTWLQAANEDDLPEYYSKKKNENLFITCPAHFSIELNAHCLLSICLLVCQNELPCSALAMYEYGAQPSEALLLQ